MSKFDTHGGYFSPDNYIRINEGGTHDENPNGGVQMGVDPEGVPNMVEEDETVYDDYVFSDNITVDDAMVEKHNLPAWAKGKLYSKVTDRLVEEAEERPMDPISRSGLEKMLGRLRDAQEEQKQIQQERELEDELSQLSPEELDQLESMLVQSEQAPVEEYPAAPEQMAGPAELVEQMPVEEMPMMRNGGFLHEYKDGGLASRIKKARAIAKAERRRIRYVSPHDRKILEKAGEIEGAERRQNLIEERTASYADAVSKRDSLQTVYNDALAALHSAEDAQLDAALNDGDFDAASKKYEEARDAMRSAKWQLKDANKSVRNANYLLGQLGVSAPLFQSATPIAPLLDTTAPSVDPTAVEPSMFENFESEPIGNLTDTAAVNKATAKNRADYDPLADAKYHALGGQMNRFEDGGYGDFYNLVTGYKPSRIRGGINGTYRIDRSFNPYMHGFSSITDYENSASYGAFTDAVIEAARAGNPRALSYLQALDNGTPESVEKLFVNGKLRGDFERVIRDRRGDGDAGIYHLTPDGDDFSTFFDQPAKYAKLESPIIVHQNNGPKGIIKRPLRAPLISDPNDPIGRNSARLDAARNGAQGIVVDENLELNPTDGVNNDGVYGTVRRTAPYLSTFPRYAGALTAGALGLYNASTPADEYTIPRINPVLPQGQLHLRDPRYNPLDEEQAVNTVLAANAGTNRQIMNSGIGPSVGATLLASDYNVGRNIGNARQTVWDANNQSRNIVNAAHNQNASALAGFDYGQSRDRAQILNEAAYRNSYNDLTRQRLNYDAEGQKYAAIQSSLDSVAQALSGIGQENSILNALNSNTALYHWLSPNRVAAYKVDTNESKDGGFLRKKKTKIEKEIEQQVRDLSEYGEALTKIERDERKKREAQQKIDNLWSPASPSELKRVFSGRKKKKN